MKYVLPGTGAALLAVALSAVAVAADSRMPDWAACRAMTDAAARLACYDAAADRLVERSTEERRQSFGLPPEAVLKQVEPAVASAEIRAEVRAVRGGQSGRLIFELDSGQIWEQVMATPDALVSVGQTVIIRSAALGSFQMATPSGRTYKVRRVR
jgi:hypothetical protein